MTAAGLAALLLISGVCSDRLRAQTAKAPLAALLPGPGELEGWSRDGEIQCFSGEDLFDYIDGGAEIYFEYGFERVVVQDYRSDAGSRLSLEIFEMSSPESAYGIYTFKTSQNGEPVPLGDECQLADYYLNLRKGPYLVTITGLDLTIDAKKSLLLLARTIEPRMGPAAARPDLVSRLPAEGLLSQSIRYFKGPLALFNSYPFSQGDVFAFSAGIKGEYGPGYSLFILEYSDAVDARSRFDRAGQSFEKSERYREFSQRGGIYLLKDSRDIRIFAERHGRHILLLIGPEDERAARRIFSLVAEKLPVS